MKIDLTDEQHEQQQEQPAAAPNRQQLADAGQEQLLLLLQSSKALLDAYSGIQPTTECQQKLAELQQAYLAVSQDIRDTLQQCQALEQQEAAAAATGVCDVPNKANHSACFLLACLCSCSGLQMHTACGSCILRSGSAHTPARQQLAFMQSSQGQRCTTRVYCLMIILPCQHCRHASQHYSTTFHCLIRVPASCLCCLSHPAAAEAAGAGGQHALPPEQQQQQQLEARAAELRARLCHQNSLVKQVIDKLRHLVDAFNMWDSHERHLVQNSVQYAVAGTGAI